MIDPEPTPWRRPLGRWNAAAVRRSIPTRPDHRVACSVAVLRFADVVRPRGAFGIENPGDSRFAPRALGMFVEREKELRQLVEAYRRRIRVARQELRRRKLPGLRLGLYQVIVPDGRGEASEEFEQRMCGYREAGRRGMYDDLDFICPVLYQRFGPLDAGAKRLRQWLDAATRQALDRSLTLTRRNGEGIPLVPILSFWVFNGKSENDRDAVTPASIGLQLQLVQQSAGIEAILFWSGSETPSGMRRAKEPVEEIDIVELLDSTGALPWPGCR
jgi:hypothetical protein